MHIGGLRAARFLAYFCVSAETRFLRLRRASARLNGNAERAWSGCAGHCLRLAAVPLIAGCSTVPGRITGARERSMPAHRRGNAWLGDGIPPVYSPMRPGVAPWCGSIPGNTARNSL